MSVKAGLSAGREKKSAFDDDANDDDFIFQSDVQAIDVQASCDQRFPKATMVRRWVRIVS